MTGATGQVHARPERAGPPLLPGAGDNPRAWQREVRDAARAHVVDVVRRRCAEHLDGVDGGELLTEVVTEFVSGGKYLRSTFAYLGWRCTSPDDEAALRACAGLELLHVFALLQDDVMDASATRRGRDTAHVRLAAWHAGRGLDGDAARFGRSAAVLLGDLCLVWAEQALRESGLPGPQLARAWPGYDAMRSELAAGQFGDLLNDARRDPSLDDVMGVLRRKSGNYTVRRPLELGAALGGPPASLRPVLAGYGTMIGEAFQLRDDVLGVFGSTATGKPAGDDLTDRKATSVLVLARRMAGPSARAELEELLAGTAGDPVDLPRCRAVIERTGAREHVEELIDGRVRDAVSLVDGSGIDDDVAHLLRHMASKATDRDR